MGLRAGAARDDRAAPHVRVTVRLSPSTDESSEAWDARMLPSSEGAALPFGAALTPTDEEARTNGSGKVKHLLIQGAGSDIQKLRFTEVPQMPSLHSSYL
jgi:hypothetical protein